VSSLGQLCDEKWNKMGLIISVSREKSTFRIFLFLAVCLSFMINKVKLIKISFLADFSFFSVFYIVEIVDPKSILNHEILTPLPFRVGLKLTSWGFFDKKQLKMRNQGYASFRKNILKYTV